MTAQQAAGAVVRVEVAVHEAAAVEEQEQRVRTTRLGGLRLIVAGAQGHRGVDLDVADGADRLRLAREHGRQAPAFAPRVTWRQSLQGLLATLEQRQHELHLGR